MVAFCTLTEKFFKVEHQFPEVKNDLATMSLNWFLFCFTSHAFSKDGFAS